MTVTGAAGTQNYGPMSWLGARPWEELRVGRAEVGGIHVEVAGAREGGRTGAKDCVSKPLNGSMSRRKTPGSSYLDNHG